MRWVGAACLVVAAASPAACSDGDGGGSRGERFCATVDQNVAALTKPELRSQDDVDAFVALYRELGEQAPLAIGDDWKILADAYATAGTADPAKPESMNEARKAIFAAERSALRVQRWLKRTCGVDLGPVSTIVNHDVKVPVPTTPPGEGG